MNNVRDDIVIVGAGLTGLAFCNLLKKTNIKISIIDIQPKSYYKTINNDRYIVLSNTSKLILESISLWNDVSKYCSKVKNIHISKKNIFGSTIVKSSDENLDSLGYQLPIKNLFQIFYDNIKNQENINFIHEAEVTGVEKGELVRTTYSKNKKAYCLLSDSVIFSSGSTDKLINKLFLDKIQKDYQHNAIACELVSDKYNSKTAYERFTNKGILGVIPRKENLWTLIYSTNKKETEIIKNFDQSEAKKYFQNLMGMKCGQLSEINNMKVYPLKMKYYKNFINENICLLGDAAHTLHPIAAQSFNLSLRDCAYLTNMIKNSDLSQKYNFNIIFDNYYKERKQEVKRLVKFTDFIASFIHGGGLLKNNIISASFLFMDMNKNLRINIIRYLLGVNFSKALIPTIKE